MLLLLSLACFLLYSFVIMPTPQRLKNREMGRRVPSSLAAFGERGGTNRLSSSLRQMTCTHQQTPATWLFSTHNYAHTSLYVYIRRIKKSKSFPILTHIPFFTTPSPHPCKRPSGRPRGSAHDFIVCKHIVATTPQNIHIPTHTSREAGLGSAGRFPSPLRGCLIASRTMDQPTQCPIKEKAIDLLLAGPAPQLIAIDLDYTFWRAFIDSTNGGPFTYDTESRVVLDKKKWEVEAFPHARSLLQAFREVKALGVDIRLALASRTEEPVWAHEVIQIFQIDDEGRSLRDYAHGIEIYPTSKDKHFQQLSKKLKVDYQDMLFFDDELRNIHQVSQMGVVSIHCEDGLSLAALEQGLNRWRQQQMHGGMSAEEGHGSQGKNKSVQA